MEPMKGRYQMLSFIITKLDTAHMLLRKRASIVNFIIKIPLNFIFKVVHSFVTTKGVGKNLFLFQLFPFL